MRAARGNSHRHRQIQSRKKADHLFPYQKSHTLGGKHEGLWNVMDIMNIACDGDPTIIHKKSVNQWSQSVAQCSDMLSPELAFEHHLSPCGPNMWERYGDFLTLTTPLRQLAARLPIGIPNCDPKLQTASVYPPNVAPPSRRNGPNPVGTDLKTSVPPFGWSLLPRLHGENMGGVDFLIGPPKWKVWKRLFCHLCHLIRLNIVLFNAFFLPTI